MNAQQEQKRRNDWIEYRAPWDRGNSKSAGKRRDRRAQGKLYRGRPGEHIRMSDRAYVVANDGSFRRVAA